MDGIEIRQIAVEDIERLASEHACAFPDFFLTALGKPFLIQFYKGFLADPTGVTAVAVDSDGRLVGAAVGTTQPRSFFPRLLKRQLWGFVWASVRAVVRHPERVPRLFRAIAYRGGPAPVAESALLSSIFVSPAVSGTGLGSRLLKAWCAEAAIEGAAGARLTTDAIDNDRVNEFYVRQGWTLQGQYKTTEGRLMNVYERGLASV